MHIVVHNCLPCGTGFFRSIALRSKSALQDILRLLTLWFKYGAQDEVSHAMSSGFTTLEVDTWLEVIPQVYFIHTYAHHKRGLIHCVDHSSYSDAFYKY